MSKLGMKTMRIDALKIVVQAAAPLTVLALVLAIVAGIVVGQRLDRVSRKPTAIESRALLAQIQGTLDSLHRQLGVTSYPVEEALQALKAKQQAPPPPVVVAVVTMAPPARVVAPLQPVVAAPPPEVALRINGIFSNKDRVLVCVNDRFLGLGGWVEGFKIVKIEPHQVTFDNQKGGIRIIRIK
jgi:hypothetical protein